MWYFLWCRWYIYQEQQWAQHCTLRNTWWQWNPLWWFTTDDKTFWRLARKLVTQVWNLPRISYDESVDNSLWCATTSNTLLKFNVMTSVCCLWSIVLAQSSIVVSSWSHVNNYVESHVDVVWECYSSWDVLLCASTQCAPLSCKPRTSETQNDNSQPDHVNHFCRWAWC